MNLEKFIELIIYGSVFGNYDDGLGLDAILPEINKMIYRNDKYLGVDGLNYL